MGFSVFGRGIEVKTVNGKVSRHFGFFAGHLFVDLLARLSLVPLRDMGGPASHGLVCAD